MKKYFLIVIMLFIIVGCSFNDNKEIETIDNSENVITIDEPIYIDNNPVIVGLYKDGKLVHNLVTPIVVANDITVLDVYFTNEENVYDTNTKRNFNKYAANYENVNKYKIGFIISFYVNEEKVVGIIKGPNDMLAATPYIYNYLYDDVHQPDGAWYSHVEADDVNENTIYSSIKLFAAIDVNKITSPIDLTVFTYDTEDDFDDNGMYRGNSKYTITIEKQ